VNDTHDPHIETAPVADHPLSSILGAPCAFAPSLDEPRSGVKFPLHGYYIGPSLQNQIDPMDSEEYATLAVRSAEKQSNLQGAHGIKTML
jgi:hypothetical protein